MTATMISNDRCKISQYIKISNLEQILKTMEECDERIDEAEKQLESILQRIKTDNEKDGLSGDIEDLLYSVALVFYAKGIIVGKKMEQLCY